MGTHNALLKLGESTYLEVLAVDPAARPPSYPRWFGLDDMRPDSAPRLAAWVARVDDVHEARDAVPALGDVMTMSRGALTWLITIPSDGSLSVGGVMPVLIQWTDGSHPAQSLANSGCTLNALRGVQTDVTRITRALGKFELDDRWSLAPAEPGVQPGLVATIQTPVGARTLATHPHA
jgi:hypothetical protein